MTQLAKCTEEKEYPLPEEYNTLNTLQRTIVDSALNRENVLVCSSAGTGKSYVINVLKQILGADLKLCATTGKAAVAISGRTVDSFIIELFRRKKNSPSLRIKWLVIDEVSMLEPTKLHHLNQLLQIGKKSTDLFGGVCILLFGDFYQLPPVYIQGSNYIHHRIVSDDLLVKYINDTSRRTFLFETMFSTNLSFNHVFKKIILTENLRQTDAPEFKAFLDDLRVNVPNQSTINWLDSNIKRTKVVDEDSIVLCATNTIRLKYNNSYLNNIPGESKLYMRTGTIKTTSEFDDFEGKVSAKVMVLKNMVVGRVPIVNGDLGIIVSMTSDTVTIELLSNKKLVVIPMTNAFSDDDKVSGTYMPLTLAYAMTVHKAQGLTITSPLVIDCQNFRLFEHGVLYTALSRCKHPSQISLMNMVKMNLQNEGSGLTNKVSAFIKSVTC